MENVHSVDGRGSEENRETNASVMSVDAAACSGRTKSCREQIREEKCCKGQNKGQEAISVRGTKRT